MRPEFQRVQYAFAAHIRDPENAPRPTDVEERRMAIYRELFFNNVVGFLDTTFPVLKSIISEVLWLSTARSFFVEHRCHSPFFLDIPKEFIEWCQAHPPAVLHKYPFFTELAHYEWAELSLGIEADVTLTAIDPNGDLLTGIPALSPLVWTLAYAFPVHKLSAEFQPKQTPENPSYLIVYRNRHDKVCFKEINAVTARLMTLLGENKSAAKTGEYCLKLIAKELKHPDERAIIAFGETIMNDLRSSGILLGTRVG